MFFSWQQINWKKLMGERGSLATFLVKGFFPKLLFSVALEGLKLS